MMNQETEGIQADFDICLALRTSIFRAYVGNVLQVRWRTHRDSTSWGFRRITSRGILLKVEVDSLITLEKGMGEVWDTDIPVSCIEEAKVQGLAVDKVIYQGMFDD